MPPSLDVKSQETFDSEIRYVAFPESNDSRRWTVKSREIFDSTFRPSPWTFAAQML